MKNKTMLIRWTHPYGFRSGEWARVLSTREAAPKGLEPRMVYHVIYDDGFLDAIPVRDSSNFEIKFVDNEAVNNTKD